MSTAVLRRQSGVLLTEMELVEPEQQAAPPPNHLVDTNIFSRIGGNDYVQVQPAEVHFAESSNKNKVCRTQMKIVRITNISRKATRVNIIPPETSYFSLSYKVPPCFVPGTCITCYIKFKPNGHQFYEDVIRVHTEDQDKHLIIPLYGYPAVGKLNFPKCINLSAVPLGSSQTHVISLQSSSFTDFDFILQKIQDHPCYQVNPMRGKLLAGQTQKIRITFTPKDYTTCTMKLLLNVSQLNFVPRCCTVTGHSEPGLESNQLKQKYVEEQGQCKTLDASDPTVFQLRPLDRTRSMRMLEKQCTTARQTKSISKCLTKSTDEKTHAFEMSCPHHVAKLLCGAGKNRSAGHENSTEKRQQQLLAFEAAVRQDTLEEQRNQVRWQAKLGQQPLSVEQRERLQTEWDLAWKRYLTSCTDPESTRLREDSKTSGIPLSVPSFQSTDEGRPHRSVQQLINLITLQPPTFRTQRIPATGWIKRTAILDRLRLGVTRLILRQRASSRLKKLRCLKENRADSKATESESPSNVGAVHIPEDIAKKIGDPLLATISQKECACRIPECWIERTLDTTCSKTGFNYPQSSVSVDVLATEESSLQAMQLTAAFVNGQDKPWPVFDLSPPWEWKLSGCEKFDPIEARELAYWTVDEPELQALTVLPFLEQNLPSTDSSAIDNSMTIIDPTDPEFPVGTPMSVPEGCLKSQKLGTETSFSLSTSEHLSEWVPSVKTVPVVTSFVQQQFAPFTKSIRFNSNSLHKPSGRMEATERTLNQINGVGAVLQRCTTQSHTYQEMVPLLMDDGPSSYGGTPEEKESLRAEMVAAEELIAEHSATTKLSPSVIATRMRDWINRFPELGPSLWEWIPDDSNLDGSRPIVRGGRLHPQLSSMTVKEVNEKVNELKEVNESSDAEELEATTDVDNLMNHTVSLEGEIWSQCKSAMFPQ
ncbi:hypothetical protein P879_00516 [Paragonimus westermani]|uniref:Cep192-like domain-containing protein n=1 Tax=Paragonimus westermani TaxID=34504 RepID=A0A8T0DY77_9TREM|nr:hypothetical protein P879_00516 [Paragonimus westermani]